MPNNLYQTLEDRNNIDYVEQYGPFKCKHNDAWLGTGYYFWDTFIEYAHWWGKTAYEYRNKSYIICSSAVKFDKEVLYDLIEPHIIYDFWQIAKELEKAYPGKNITVAFVLEYLKEKAPSFTYQAIRARVEGATRQDKTWQEYRLPFKKEDHKAYLEMCSHIQVCVLDKQFIGKNNFYVIHPPEYAKNYTI